MPELWSGARVAKSIGYTYNYFMNTVRYWPGVPQPIDKPGHPRWVASDWADWIEKSRNNHAKAA